VALEEARKRLVKDIEALQRQVEELQAANEKLDKSKKKIQAELEDSTIELDLQRAKVIELEKKQKNFDKVLMEEKAISMQYAELRDTAEREAREKETKVLSLTRELDELNDKVEELERGRKSLQAELDELVNNQGTADKNVHDLEKAKRLLESKIAEQQAQVEELEDELQCTEDAKLRLEVNMQAMRSQFERELQAKEEQAEEKRRGLVKQLRDLEAELGTMMSRTLFAKLYNASIIKTTIKNVISLGLTGILFIFISSIYSELITDFSIARTYIHLNNINLNHSKIFLRKHEIDY
jgi:myosin protein heavy chain